MTEVATYSQSYHSEVSFPRLPARPFEAHAGAASRLSRDMAYNHYSNGGYYAPPTAPSREPLEPRSSSVSSTSSSVSYATPYNTSTGHHAGISRTISPASGSFDSGMGAPVTYSRNHYPVLAHEHSQYHAATSQPSQLPSQLIQAQVASLSMYSPFPTPRQYSPPPSYDYQVAPMSHHLPSLPHGSYGSVMFPSPATTAYHPQPCLPPYPTPPPPPRNHHPSMINRPASPEKTSVIADLLANLPPDVIRNIREKVTYRHCWKAYLANRWFRENFHPYHRFTTEEKLAGLRNMEKYWGRDDCEDSGVPSSRKPSGKVPDWFACYHCLRPRGPEYFERYNHKLCSPSSKTEDDNNDEDKRRPSGRRQQSYTPPTPPTSSPSPPANPHYDPSLTRSSLRAKTARNSRRASPVSSSSATDPGETSLELRQKKTLTVMRFCIDCGLRLGIYEPGDLVEVHKPLKSNDAVWVCGCFKLRHRAEQAQCHVCGHHVPFSTAVVPLLR